MHCSVKPRAVQPHHLFPPQTVEINLQADSPQSISPFRPPTAHNEYRETPITIHTVCCLLAKGQKILYDQG